MKFTHPMCSQLENLASRAQKELVMLYPPTAKVDFGSRCSKKKSLTDEKAVCHLQI